ncbi:Putative anti-sigma factor antagonist BtrV [Anaerolineae bacterium]|nr:Putative anti-sigma factor antagonist BtrV [Anaerolineae bacterium]
MEITVSREQGRAPITVFHLKGDLNAASYEEFQSRVKQAIDAGERDLVIDFTAVPYMSSAGLRALNQIFNWLEPNVSGKDVTSNNYKSAHLRLVNPAPRVLETLKIAGYDMFVEIYQDLKLAVASF